MESASDLFVRVDSVSRTIRKTLLIVVSNDRYQNNGSNGLMLKRTILYGNPMYIVPFSINASK